MKMNSQFQTIRMKYEGGSNASDKCIEKLVRLIEYKDYSQMEQITRDIDFNQNHKQASTDLAEHQAANTLYQTIMSINYDGVVYHSKIQRVVFTFKTVVDTFKTLDETAKVVLIQNFELTTHFNGVMYFLGKNKGQDVNKLDIMIMLWYDLLATLRSNTSTQPTEVIVEAKETSYTGNKNGSAAALKCIEMATQLIESKDYSKMSSLQQDSEFHSNMTNANYDLDRYQNAMELFNVIMSNKYDGVESTFESLDEQAKLILVQNFEMSIYFQYTFYLAKYKGKNMDQIDQMFSPMKNLLAVLKSKL